MQRSISNPSSQATPIQPVMLSIPERQDIPSGFEKVDPNEDPLTWSDQMREIEQLEDPERWDGMS